MCRLRVQLDRRQVMFLRFLLEGYEGLATTSTIDRFASIVELHVPQEQVAELYALLHAERERLGISRIDEGAL